MATNSPKKREYKQAEDTLQIQVSKFLNLQYPHVIFTSEASGGKMSKQAAIRAALKRSGRGLPDLWILQPTEHYCGLLLELKKEDTAIICSTGTRKGQLVSSEHIQEQYNNLEKLRKLGYFADFVVGFDEAIETIKNYMNGEILPIRYKPIEL